MLSVRKIKDKDRPAVCVGAVDEVGSAGTNHYSVVAQRCNGAAKADARSARRNEAPSEAELTVRVHIVHIRSADGEVVLLTHDDPRAARNCHCRAEPEVRARCWCDYRCTRTRAAKVDPPNGSSATYTARSGILAGSDCSPRATRCNRTANTCCICQLKLKA